MLEESIKNDEKAAEATKNQADIDEVKLSEVSIYLYTALAERFTFKGKLPKQTDKNKTAPKQADKNKTKPNTEQPGNSQPKQADKNKTKPNTEQQPGNSQPKQAG